MTTSLSPWGAGPSPRYASLAARFRPIFERIRAGNLDRELTRTLPHEPIQWLKAAGFTRLRLSEADGGDGATIPELFALLIELAEADSNIAQALRAHLSFVEDLLNSRLPERRAVWIPRIAAGEIIGSAWTETGAQLSAFSASLLHDGEAWRLNGTKFYTTGSLYAEWISVGATDAEGQPISAVVARTAEGVDVLDDWNGFGQRQTASGTARFVDARVDDTAIVRESDHHRYWSAFLQQVQLATLAGIGRAAAREAAQAVARRERTYTHAAAARSSQDPQVLQIVGRVQGNAYAAGATVLKAAEAIQRAYEVRDAHDEASIEEVNLIAELEVAQAQTVVSNLVLDATTLLFDALGASATLTPAGFDRFWRNARTLASHNPRIYKDRIVGDFAVNGTPPPYQWRVGRAVAQG
ncbi:acyl-CoA dehydrogenase family protein [Pararobbsia silviterrae]|uniref:Monooxygenase n=1 Tax=Pararobbsia silviterrae TaxID=1792498 RepID=A0A494Y5I5_9BURK|nr:acyl-CoA dehydrogenase family protein [Pararobbsia silviterrae]RKP56773.1 monooxygenase [Pararobbsia silviterrae]